MPFKNVPFQDHYRAGDLFYGLSGPRQILMTTLCHGRAFIQLKKDQGWIDTFSVKSGTGKTQRNKDFIGTTQAHARYQAATVGEKPGKDSAALLWNNNVWRQKSKSGLHWAAMVSNHTVH